MGLVTVMDLYWLQCKMLFMVFARPVLPVCKWLMPAVPESRGHTFVEISTRRERNSWSD
jgi:hypothetical protein